MKSNHADSCKLCGHRRDAHTVKVGAAPTRFIGCDPRTCPCSIFFEPHDHVPAGIKSEFERLRNRL